MRVIGALLLSAGLLGIAFYTTSFLGLVRLVDQEVLVRVTVYAIAVGILAVISLLGYLALTAPAQHVRVNRGGGG
ncbi:MAG: hypothetical protein QXI60_10120 [Thermofilaceae archaeon]